MQFNPSMYKVWVGGGGESGSDAFKLMQTSLWTSPHGGILTPTLTPPMLQTIDLNQTN